MDFISDKASCVFLNACNNDADQVIVCLESFPLISSSSGANKLACALISLDRNL